MARMRGIMVQPVNSEDYLPYRSAIGVDPDGQTYLICTEGVGHPIGEETFELVGPMVDLADWVRTFGSRLEVNFRLWAHTLTHPDDHTEA